MYEENRHIEKCQCAVIPTTFKYRVEYSTQYITLIKLAWSRKHPKHKLLKYYNPQRTIIVENHPR